jgi:hypothetical protein
MLDSEGYGSDEFVGDDLRNQLLSALRFETELNAVILAVSFERFRLGLKDDLAHLMGLIKTLGIDERNFIVCLTHCEMYTDKAREGYAKEFVNYYSLNVAPADIIFGCFANIDEINDTYKPLIVESVKLSITNLREKIYSKSEAMNVAMKILTIESPAQPPKA